MNFTFLLLICINFYFASSQTCTFSNDCTCLDVGGDKRKVMCENLATFPTFSKATVNLTTMEITGSFPSIPKNAFSNLSGRIYYLGIIRNGDNSVQLVVDDDALANTGDNLFSTVLFDNFNSMTSVPALPLSRASGLSNLYFNKCNFTTLPNSAFTGLVVNSISLTNNNIKTIADNAFQGLESSLITLRVNEKLTEVPVQALKPLLSLSSLDLSGNQITTVPSYSFASLFGLTKLVLDKNPISDNGLANNSFFDVINLSSVSMSGCQFHFLPTNALLPTSATLTSLTISDNLITNIPSYAFQKFTNLQTVDISNNPVTTLAPYAFYGLLTDSFVVESLNSLLTVSLDVFNGMPNAGTVGFHHCDNLMNISYVDASKLPPTLNAIMLTMDVDFQGIDNSVQDWLMLSEDNVLNIKGITNFNCTPSISWMYPWVFCTTNVQIFDVASSVFCANTNTEFQIYLQSLPLSC